jgi:putative pyruvate formate lyase activating enzyme
MKFLKNSSDVKAAAKELFKVYENCTLCPRDCKVDRTKGRFGYCNSVIKARVATSVPHFGEEPFISGKSGSGTIFFSNCNMKCQFCQNYQISQDGLGQEVSDEELSQMMMDLQAKGCYNINLVSPTHYLPNIINALGIALEKGFTIPVVYNTNGYDKVNTLRIIDMLVDIYMPDIKYSDNEVAVRLSDAPNYVQFNRSAIEEMHRQVGDLTKDKDGIAEKGLIVRHLVLPNDLAGSMSSFKFLASISRNMNIGIMAQYTPCHKAASNEEISRKISLEEYQSAIDLAKVAGLHNILIQALESADFFVPDFKEAEPFKKKEPEKPVKPAPKKMPPQTRIKME